MDRKLAIELLRIAVTQKILNGELRQLRTEDWDRLEGELQAMADAQRDKLPAHQSEARKKITPPDIKTMQNFLELPEEEIKRLRTTESEKEGIPLGKTRAYLLQILGFGFTELRDFERCVMAIGLHPDTVKSEKIDLLRTIKDHLQQNKTAAGTSTPIETSEDAAMEQDAIESEHNPKGASRSVFDLPEDMDEEPAGAPSSGRRSRSANQVTKTAVWVGLTVGVAVAAFFSARFFLGWGVTPPPPQVLPPVTKTEINATTRGDFSPVIQAEGDANYQVGNPIANKDTVSVDQH